MKLRPYLAALAAGIGAAAIFALFDTASPAPPWPALAGLLGILAGEHAGVAPRSALRRILSRRRSTSAAPPPKGLTMSMQYPVSLADRQPLPRNWFTEERYLGYRDADHAKPYAKYFQERTLPVQAHVPDAISAGPTSSEFGVRVLELADHMNKPGYRHLETGWTINADGHMVVAVLTDMPGVTGEMWDWWFGWHSVESARYKLWNPDAHQFAALAEDRSADRNLTDRQRYHYNVSYINEYIGASSYPIAVHFVDPEKYGFISKPGETTILIRGGSPAVPVTQTWLVHQIRRTDRGTEMRSRFVFGDVSMLNVPPRAIDGSLGKALTAAPLRALAGAVLPHVLTGKKQTGITAPMIQHCAGEMNHLATFLPQLWEEFKDMP